MDLGKRLTRSSRYDFNRRRTSIATKIGTGVLQSIAYGLKTNDAITHMANAGVESPNDAYRYDELLRVVLAAGPAPVIDREAGVAAGACGSGFNIDALERCVRRG